MTKGTPANISQLVKDANNKSSWKIRLAALNELNNMIVNNQEMLLLVLLSMTKFIKLKRKHLEQHKLWGLLTAEILFA